MITFPFVTKVLEITQPMGTFYVAVIPAEVLLETAFSDRLSATLNPAGTGYDLTGTQRLAQPKRMQPIADFINRYDSVFPNSIIVAANFREEDGLIEQEEDDQGNLSEVRWTIEADKEGNQTLTIPSDKKLAAIIDGQHRLFAFAQASTERLGMSLLCSIFIDLPKPYQAQIFATINSTQKPVDRSLTYELFGYNIEEEKEFFWSPDKLAVYLTRRLSIEEKSPLRGRVVISPKKDNRIELLSKDKNWRVSTAVIVDGIIKLISSNPKKDITHLLDKERKTRLEISGLRNDNSPLRKAYLNNEDLIIYTMVLNYLKAAESTFWKDCKPDSFIIRTVGIHATLDILKKLALESYNSKNISEDYFIKKLEPAKAIDFSEDVYKNSSGSGRSIIRRAIEKELGIDVKK